MDMQKSFMQIGNALMKAVLRSPLHWVISNTTLLIAVIGRKSGCEYTLPVNYVRDGDILYITSTRGREWWRNLRGGMPVRVCLQGRDLAAEGIVVEECASVFKNLKRFFQIHPKYAEYFDVHLDVNGKPDEQDISRVARECVIVKIGLNGGREKTHVLLHRQMVPNIMLYGICSSF